mgnify:CR=1 FL=1
MYYKNTFPLFNVAGFVKYYSLNIYYFFIIIIMSNIAPDSIAKQDKQKFMLHNVQEGLSIFFIKRVDIQKCINGPRRTYSMTRVGLKKIIQIECLASKMHCNRRQILRILNFPVISKSNFPQVNLQQHSWYRRVGPTPAGSWPGVCRTAPCGG